MKAVVVAKRKVCVLYNSDYDEDLMSASPTDTSAVRDAAEAVANALEGDEFSVELRSVHGKDLAAVIIALQENPPDLVFNLCESLAGDCQHEPVIPAVLDMLGVPYTGSNALGLTLALYKDRTKERLIARGVATPSYYVLENAKQADAFVGETFPYFIKLLHEDASVGITEKNVAYENKQVTLRAKELLQEFQTPLLVERYIEGREVNVTLLGNDSARIVLPLHEIDFSKMPEGRPHIVSYAAKWDEEHVDYEGTKPVPLQNASQLLIDSIETIAKDAASALGLRDYCRVDLRIDGSGKPWVIDVNPNCDISPDAGVPRAAKAAGMDYRQLLITICQKACERVFCTDSVEERTMVALS